MAFDYSCIRSDKSGVATPCNKKVCSIFLIKRHLFRKSITLPGKRHNLEGVYVENANVHLHTEHRQTCSQGSNSYSPTRRYFGLAF